MIPLLIGAAAGALKYDQDRRQAERDAQTQGTIAAYSPWTGMQANSHIAQPSALGSIAGGAATGASMGQSMDSADAQGAMNAKQGGLIDAQTNYYNNMTPQQTGYAQPMAGSAGSYGNKMQQPGMSPWPQMGQQNQMYS